MNQTILTFMYNGYRYEVDWLTDATCFPDQKVCDIFRVDGQKEECVGQIVIFKDYDRGKIKRLAIEEIDQYAD